MRTTDDDAIRVGRQHEGVTLTLDEALWLLTAGLPAAIADLRARELKLDAAEAEFERKVIGE